MGRSRTPTAVLAAADLAVLGVAAWATVRSWVPNEMGTPTFAVGPTLLTAVVIMVFAVGVLMWLVVKSQTWARGIFVMTLVLATVAALTHLNEFD